MNVLITLLAVAVVVLGWFMRSLRAEVSALRARQAADMLSLSKRLDVALPALAVAVDRGIADLRAKMPGNHHWADDPPPIAPLPESKPSTTKAV